MSDRHLIVSHHQSYVRFQRSTTEIRRIGEVGLQGMMGHKDKERW